MSTHHKNILLTTLIKSLILVAIGSSSSFAQKVYVINKGDTTLTPQFIHTLCQAARAHTEIYSGGPSKLEQLIRSASGSSSNFTKVSQKSLQWSTKYGPQVYCEATKSFPAGNLLRQVVYSNYRDFANIIGPKNRLPLNLTAKDAHDGMDIFEFIDLQRKKLEAKHDNRRFEFQQDKDWQNIMFFYFLFSEYKINYGAKLK